MKDHLLEHQESIDLVKSLRDLTRPRQDSGYGLTAAEVARALGMHPKGTGVRAWTGRWNPVKKRFEGGRNIPQPGPLKERLSRFVARHMRAWGKRVLSEGRRRPAGQVVRGPRAS